MKSGYSLSETSFDTYGIWRDDEDPDKFQIGDGDGCDAFHAHFPNEFDIYYSAVDCPVAAGARFNYTIKSIFSPAYQYSGTLMGRTTLYNQPQQQGDTVFFINLNYIFSDQC